MIAVSLNVGGGVRLIKPEELYMCKQKHYKHIEDGCTAPVVRGHDSVPLSHSGNAFRYENWITITTTICEHRHKCLKANILVY